MCGMHSCSEISVHYVYFEAKGAKVTSISLKSLSFLFPSLISCVLNSYNHRGRSRESLQFCSSPLLDMMRFRHVTRNGRWCGWISISDVSDRNSTTDRRSLRCNARRNWKTDENAIASFTSSPSGDTCSP